MSVLNLMLSAGLSEIAQARNECIGKCSHARDWEECINRCESERCRGKNRPASCGTAGSVPSEWHCVCYKEIVRGHPKLSTACRPKPYQCWSLYGSIQRGSSILVKDSQIRGCSKVNGKHPARGTNTKVDIWLSSSHRGSWWTPSGCFLNKSHKKSPGQPPKATPTPTLKPEESPSLGLDSAAGEEHQAPDPCTPLRECERACGGEKCSEQGQCMIRCRSEKDIPSTCTPISLHCVE